MTSASDTVRGRTARLAATEIVWLAGRQAGRRLLRRGMVRLLLSSSFCHRGTIYLTRHDLGELT
jgi:hypothetical protein